MSRSWIYELVARYHAEGEAAFEPRSRRPRTQPNAILESTVEVIVELRRQLSSAGLDAGADTIAWHLEHHRSIIVSRATIYRTLRRVGLVTPEPAKKPKASYIRFQAEQPNETWQGDFTHWSLADGSDVEILTWLDDHSRYAVSLTAHQRVTGAIVVATFRAAVGAHGVPFSTLTDNGLVFTARFAGGGRTSRNGFENELVKLRVRQKNSQPNHPTTCGKVERFQQTVKKWLRAQPPARTLAELQQQLDVFVAHYNRERPHRSLANHSTPAAAYMARPKATPANTTPDREFRVRHDRVSYGAVSIRVDGHLHHIGLSRTLNGTRIVVLIEGYNIRVVNPATGELIRELTINPDKRYHGTGAKRGGPTRPYGPQKTRQPQPNEGSDCP